MFIISFTKKRQYDTLFSGIQTFASLTANRNKSDFLIAITKYCFPFMMDVYCLFYGNNATEMPISSCLRISIRVVEEIDCLSSSKNQTTYISQGKNDLPYPKLQLYECGIKQSYIPKTNGLYWLRQYVYKTKEIERHIGQIIGKK
jgi:hypothetical protein